MKRFNYLTMTTIKDIAKAARVSIGTVSNYFNNPDLLSKETYKKIHVVIDDFNFHPHSAARSLKSQHTRKIGIIPVVSPQDNFGAMPSDNVFLEFLAAANAASAERGYGILMEAVVDDRLEVEKYKKLIGEKQVDGFLLLGTHVRDERIMYLLDEKFPFISFGRTEIGQPYPYVDVDGAKGIEDAVTYLAGLGHRRIGFIKPPDGLMCSKTRLEGFMNAMEKFNCVIDPNAIVEGNFSEESGKISLEKIIDSGCSITALFAPNDLSALGVMRAMSERSIKPGKDISVIGFDDLKLSAFWNPSLTTISQPIRHIGLLAVNALIDILEERDEFPQIIVEPRLVIRESTAIAG